MIANCHRPTRQRRPLSGPRALANAATAFGLLAALSAPGFLSAQLVEEDLPVEAQLVPLETEDEYRAALELFTSVDQADSIPLFTRVVEQLQPMAGTDDERVLELLHTSLLYRAQANFNFGETESARADLETLVRRSPGYQIEVEGISDRVADLFESIREDVVGYAEFIIDPPDARVTVAGERIPTEAGPAPILAGPYTADIRRPGYTPVTISFEVDAGETTSVETMLERSSAVLSLRTRPAGARVFVDGSPRGETAGTAGTDFAGSGAAAAYDRSEFSDLLWIDDLAPGRHQLSVRKPGFREFETSVEIDGLVDIPLGPVLLEQQAGTLVLGGLASDAQVEIDGIAMRPLGGRQGAELALAPGSYVLSVHRGVYGRFETTVDIRDRERTEVAVVLRPALVQLGVLGRDDVGAQRLLEGLGDALQARNDWTILDRAAVAGPLLGELGLDAGSLRNVAAGGDGGDIDWSRVQSTFDDQLPGSVYVLGVLTDDLVANEALLWVWPASPGPARPETRRVSLEDPDALDRLVEGFQPTLSPVRPTIGATLVDTPLADGPVVVDLVAGGPAESAGLRVGDTIRSLGGVPTFSQSLLFTELVRREAGETVEVVIGRGGQESTVSLTTGSSWTVIDLSDPNRMAAPVAAALAAELQRDSSWPRWVLRLNQARILLHADDVEGAVRELRQIDAATVPPREDGGLGGGTIDYWLGFALERAGPRYLDRAREAYERAAAAPGARFLHDDGPRVAPRAWARLQRIVP